MLVNTNIKGAIRPNMINTLFVFFLFFFLAAPTLGGESSDTESKPSQLNGEQIFQEKGCIGCHTIGGGKLAGPDLLGVTQRREEAWLLRWIKAPDEMVFTDPIAKEMLMEYYVPMPNQGLNDEEVKAVVEYLKQKDLNIQNTGR